MTTYKCNIHGLVVTVDEVKNVRRYVLDRQTISNNAVGTCALLTAKTIAAGKIKGSNALGRRSASECEISVVHGGGA